MASRKLFPDRAKLAYTASYGAKGGLSSWYAPKIVSSFRVQAVNATFLGLPLARNLS